MRTLEGTVPGLSAVQAMAARRCLGRRRRRRARCPSRVRGRSGKKPREVRRAVRACNLRAASAAASGEPPEFTAEVTAITPLRLPLSAITAACSVSGSEAPTRTIRPRTRFGSQSRREADGGGLAVVLGVVPVVAPGAVAVVLSKASNSVWQSLSTRAR